MGEVIECSKCYHLQQTAPDAGYCGHMHVNPCYRGLHREPKVTPVVLEKLPPLPPRHHMSNSEKGCLAARERKVKAVAPLGSGKYTHLIKPQDRYEAADQVFRSHDHEVPLIKKRRRINWADHHELIVKMNKQGFSARQIAREIECSSWSINEYIRSLNDQGISNLKPFGNRKYFFEKVPEFRIVAGNKTKKQKYDYPRYHNRIFEMLIAGQSYGSIEDATGIPKNAIWNYIRLYAKNKEDKNV